LEYFCLISKVDDRLILSNLVCRLIIRIGQFSPLSGKSSCVIDEALRALPADFVLDGLLDEADAL